MCMPVPRTCSLHSKSSITCRFIASSQEVVRFETLSREFFERFGMRSRDLERPSKATKSITAFASQKECVGFQDAGFRTLSRNTVDHGCSGLHLPLEPTPDKLRMQHNQYISRASRPQNPSLTHTFTTIRLFQWLHQSTQRNEVRYSIQLQHTLRMAFRAENPPQVGKSSYPMSPRHLR